MFGNRAFCRCNFGPGFALVWLALGTQPTKFRESPIAGGRTKGPPQGGAYRAHQCSIAEEGTIMKGGPYRAHQCSIAEERTTMKREISDPVGCAGDTIQVMKREISDPVGCASG